MIAPSSKAPAAVPPGPSTEQVLSLVMPHCLQHTKLSAMQFVSRQMHAAVHNSQAWTNTTTLLLNSPYRDHVYAIYSSVAHFFFYENNVDSAMKQRSELEPISDLLYLMPNVRRLRLGWHLPFVIPETVMDRLTQWKQLHHVALYIHTDSNSRTINFYKRMLGYIADNRGLFPKLRFSLKLENDGSASLDQDRIQKHVDTLQLALCTGCAFTCLKLHIDPSSSWAPPEDSVDAMPCALVPPVSFSNVTVTHLNCQPINIVWLQQVINELKPASLEQITLKARPAYHDWMVGWGHISTRSFLHGIRDEQLSQVQWCTMPYWQNKSVASNSNLSCAYLRVQIVQILEKMPKLVFLDLGPSWHCINMPRPFPFEWASFKEVINLLLQRSLQQESDVQVWIDECIHFASDLDDLVANLHETYKEEYCVATKITWHERDCSFEGLRLWVTLLHARTGHTLKLSCI